MRFPKKLVYGELPMEPLPNKPERESGRRSRDAFSIGRFYRLNRRIMIWLVLGGLLWLLSPFFSLIFLIFVFSFIANPIADFFVKRTPLNRQVSIVLTFGIFVTVLVAVSIFIVPQVAREAFTVVGNLPKTEQRILELRQGIIEKYPAVEPILMNYLRSSIPDAALAKIPLETPVVAPTLPLPGVLPDITAPPSEAGTPPLSSAELEIQRTAKQDEAIIHLFMKQQIVKLTDALPGLIRAMWAALATILLALPFSFLISMDISRLGREVRNLGDSRLRDFYREVAQPVVRFAYVVGRAIQAQAVIAVVNTILTFLGLLILGLPSLAVLSTIVFLFSFIPVLGVFISTTPIVLVALNAGGVNLAVLSVLLVVLVHGIEAYALNPMIYGRHLKLNPVLVLIILFIGHHFFGVWGMLLGVPVVHYFIHDVFGVPIWNEHLMEPKAALANGGATVPPPGPGTPPKSPEGPGRPSRGHRRPRRT